MTKVISGFPGIGKSEIYKLSQQYGGRILDSDSSTFSWVEAGIRNPEFPNNYIDYISRNLGFAKIIMISSHDIVRRALEENGIDYILVYPDKSLKEEYVERYKQRGNTQAFIDFMNSNWDKFISDIECETFPKLFKLNQGEFLSSIFHLDW